MRHAPCRLVICGLLAIVFLNGCGGSLSAPAAVNTHTAAFGFHADAAWVPQAPSSTMRVAQYELPGADANFTDDDASLVVYHFGTGGAGNIQANIDRWIGQFEVVETDASNSLSTSTRTVNGLAVHEVDVSGRYIAETAPGSGEQHDKPGYRMLAAIVETDGGPYYFKLVGPADTVTSWQASYERMIESIDPAAAQADAESSTAAHP